MVQHIGDDADDGAVDRADGEADQVAVAELVGVVRRGKRGRVNRQPGTAEFSRRGPSPMPSNRMSSSPECQRRPATLSGPTSAGSVSTRAPSEPRLRLIGTDADHDLAANPVRTADPADITSTDLPDLAGLQQVDADVPAPGEGADHRPQRAGGAPAPADDLAEVVRVDPDLKDVAAAQHALRAPGRRPGAPTIPLTRCSRASSSTSASLTAVAGLGGASAAGPRASAAGASAAGCSRPAAQPRRARPRRAQPSSPLRPRTWPAWRRPWPPWPRGTP